MSKRIKTYMDCAIWAGIIFSVGVYVLAPFAHAQTTLPAPAVLVPVEGSSIETSPVTFSGTGLPGAEIFATSNTANTTAAITSDGTWNVSLAMPSGTSTAAFSVFNESGVSATTTRTIAVINGGLNPPPVDTPTDGFEITGSSNPGTTVRIETPSGAQCEATANENGRYTCTLNKSPNDGESIVAQAINSLGQSSAPTNIPNAIQLAPNTERGFLREGIFGCSAGQFAFPTGTLQAIGGIYVPVNDAAVTLNTGYLVYKECVLDGVIVAMREAATAAVVKSSLNYINTGNNGAPLYPGIKNYLLEHTDEVTLEFLDEYNIGNVCAPFKNNVRVALAREYRRQTRDPASALRCSLGLQPADQEAFLKGDFAKGGFRGLIELVTNQRNNPYGAYLGAQDSLTNTQSRREAERLELLRHGNGFIPAEDVVEVPTATGETRLERRILTPGFIISRQLEQVSGSGFRQLESAGEIDQIISALFSGIGNQILTDTRGLTGLSESRRGKPPYLEQLSSESSARVRQSASNAALTALTSSLTVEDNYNTLKKSIVAILLKAKSDLESTEAKCWNLIIPAVEQAAKDAACETIVTGTNSEGGDITQTICGEPIPFTAATSTQFSSGVVDSDIAPLLSKAEQDVRDSNSAIVLIGRLINDVRNTASQTIQRIALEKLDTLIANHSIHTAFDIKDAQQQEQNVKETMSPLVEDTITKWGSEDGWCNVANSAVVQTWFNRWRTDQ